LDEKQIRDMVRKALQRELGGDTTSSKIITEADINEVAEGGFLRVAPGSILTPLARETVMMRRITLVGDNEPLPQPPQPASVQAKIVAIGADHGGYPMKEMLKEFLGREGYSALDMGTNSRESVDYPDYAHPVAEAVAEKRAWRGIIIDGAGIGSAMVANKVPGVRAALCYDQATAVNSREHNDANVLTLGAGLIGDSLAKQIVKIWLITDFGGGRHARRVNKIMAVERKYR
jgi:ribose 5-phosphate isomerase B